MSEAALRLRRAGSGDAPTLAALAAANLPEPWSEAGFARQLERLEARVWLASAGGVALGFLAAHRVLDELQILSLAVAAPARRRGTGRALLEALLAHEPGVRQIHLEVRSNDPAAHAFYRSLGFRSVGRRPGFYPGGIDALLLARVPEGGPGLDSLRG